MKATELRIENLIYNSIGKESKVIAIEFEALNDSCYSVVYPDGGYEELSHISPIPLTDEWLIKLGFKRKEKIVNEDVYIKGPLGIFPDYHIVVYYVETCKDGSHTIPITLKYVHQLQNLYFALTGEELELNTETK